MAKPAELLSITRNYQPSRPNCDRPVSNFNDAEYADFVPYIYSSSTNLCLENFSLKKSPIEIISQQRSARETWLLKKIILHIGRKRWEKPTSRVFINRREQTALFFVQGKNGEIEAICIRGYKSLHPRLKFGKVTTNSDIL